MAKKDSSGGYICGHCGSTSVEIVRFENRGKGVERLHLKCLKCGGMDYYDSCDN